MERQKKTCRKAAFGTFTLVAYAEAELIKHAIYLSSVHDRHIFLFSGVL